MRTWLTHGCPVVILLATVVVVAAVVASEPRANSRLHLSGDRVHDFGLVEIRETEYVDRTWRFALTNDSGEQVAIHSISASCGCVDAKPVVDRADPGKALEIEAILRVSSSGHKRETVWLHLHDGTRDELTLSAEGRRKHTLLLPNQIIDVAADQPAETLVQFLSYDPDGDVAAPTLEWDVVENVFIELRDWRKLENLDLDRGFPARWQAMVRVSLTESLAGQSTVLLWAGDSNRVRLFVRPTTP